MRVRYSFSSRHTRTMDLHNQHRQAFPKIVRELINTSDIILEVLDARFLQDTRNAELESFIKEKERKIIYVINKTDLVDIKKLKKEIESLNLRPYALVSCTEKRSGILREIIMIEAKKIDPSTRIKQKFSNNDTVNIGIIGYPNTGKSSIINLLVRKNVARVASESGFTKGIQKLKLSENLYLFDTPGVIPDSQVKRNSKLVKIGVKTFDKINQPEMYIADLMKQFPRLLENYYNIKADGNSEILIEELGRKKNWIRKGNQVDADKTARFILKDWQLGRIKE